MCLLNGMFRGLGAILFKEFIVVLRDPMTLFFMLFPPLIEMIAFGYALDNDVRRMSLVVFDQARTVESRRLVEQFANTESFRVTRWATSREEMASTIRRGKAYAGLEIPPGFSRESRAGRPVTVQLAIDGSNSTTALQALNTGQAVVLMESLTVLMNQAGVSAVPIEIRPQVLYNPAMRSPNFFVPGVIGVVLQISTTFATAMAIVRERERGTLEQLLVSPLSSWGLMLGKLVPYFCIGSLMAFFLFSIMRFVFQVPINGNLGGLVAATVFYIFALLSLGLLISTRAQNQMQALQMSMVLILPSVFFSGFIFPRETMPWIFYAIGSIMPTTYFIDLMRAIILRGAYFTEVLPSLSILAVMSLFLFWFCSAQFRSKVG